MEINIKINLSEILSEDLIVIKLAQERHRWLSVLNTVMNLLDP
jgi:hypothetical protein